MILKMERAEQLDLARGCVSHNDRSPSAAYEECLCVCVHTMSCSEKQVQANTKSIKATAWDDKQCVFICVLGIWDLERKVIM